MQESTSRRGPGGWRWFGQERPPFAEEPHPGQESVWDYPRPPRIAEDAREVVVCIGDLELARTRRARRVLETASPPTFYLPPEDVRMEVLHPLAGRSHCEWKGSARYWGLGAAGAHRGAIGWSYPEPSAAFAALCDWLSFYPALCECTVDGERVRPQPGGFYGGWLTSEIAGPVKGTPGTGGW